MGHVEAINHSFTVNEDGVREFFTTISFVRGVICDARGNYISRGAPSLLSPDPKIDKDTRTLPPIDDVNQKTVFGTSDKLDPDPDKLRGD